MSVLGTVGKLAMNLTPAGRAINFAMGAGKVINNSLSDVKNVVSGKE
jgi:hypothetical protein